LNVRGRRHAFAHGNRGTIAGHAGIDLPLLHDVFGMSGKIGQHKAAAVILVGLGDRAQDRNACMYPQPFFLQKNPFSVTEINVARLKYNMERRDSFSTSASQNFLHEMNQAVAEAESVLRI
jgi:hypothetical protein